VKSNDELSSHSRRCWDLFAHTCLDWTLRVGRSNSIFSLADFDHTACFFTLAVAPGDCRGRCSEFSFLPMEPRPPGKTRGECTKENNCIAGIFDPVNCRGFRNRVDVWDSLSSCLLHNGYLHSQLDVVGFAMVGDELLSASPVIQRKLNLSLASVRLARLVCVSLPWRTTIGTMRHLAAGA